MMKRRVGGATLGEAFSKPREGNPNHEEGKPKKSETKSKSGGRKSKAFFCPPIETFQRLKS
jgi:hypothetical protein